MISNWLLGEFSRMLNVTGDEVTDTRITPEQLCRLLEMINKDAISGPSAKQVFEEMFNTGNNVNDIVSKLGVSQISDTSELEATIAEVIAANPQAVADFKGGKAQSITFLIGQVMKATRGRANPKLVDEILKNKLERED
jgi:aspartyl-tRNA(Asn)/glutamyl-tRNA(Gln) amidotransferase subunit B